MKLTKTRTPFWTYCHLLKVFVSGVAQKGLETMGFGNTLPQYLPNSKNKFPVKLIFT